MPRFEAWSLCSKSFPLSSLHYNNHILIWQPFLGMVMFPNNAFIIFVFPGPTLGQACWTTWYMSAKEMYEWVSEWMNKRDKCPQYLLQAYLISASQVSNLFFPPHEWWILVIAGESCKTWQSIQGKQPLMNSTRQKSFIKHYLHKNQLWRVLLKYVPATATQMNQRLTPRAAGSRRHTLQGQKWTELKDSQPGLLIQYFVAFSFTIFVLFLTLGKDGETRLSREEHTCCHLIPQVLFFLPKQLLALLILLQILSIGAPYLLSVSASFLPCREP